MSHGNRIFIFRGVFGDAQLICTWNMLGAPKANPCYSKARTMSGTAPAPMGEQSFEFYAMQIYLVIPFQDAKNDRVL
jgi:hypothetical protein